MGKCCKSCGKKGLFLRLDYEGLCFECANAKKIEYEKELEAQRRKAEEEQKLEIEKRKQEKQQRLIDIRYAIPEYQIILNSDKIKRRSGFDCPEFSNITPKGKYPDFTVFDTETTGLSAQRDRIVELCAVKFRDYKPVARFCTYINPKREIPEEAFLINHISNDMVADAPTIEEVISSFDSFVGDDLLIAHNLKFDLKFIYSSGSTITDVKRKYIDTLEQAQRMLKKAKMKDYEIDYDKDFDVFDYTLETLCDYYHVVIPQKHSAFFDAFATGQLFLKLIEDKQDMTYPLMDWNAWK